MLFFYARMSNLFMCIHQRGIMYLLHHGISAKLKYNFFFSDEPETISISQAIQQANRAISESCPDYLQGYLALTDSIIDHIENAKPSDPSTELKPLKKV